MNLPQELLEEILSHLPLEDEQGKQSLQKCSLVAKSWVNPSQRRLFETVEIQDKTLNLWLDDIPSTALMSSGTIFHSSTDFNTSAYPTFALPLLSKSRSSRRFDAPSRD